jgi:hypothetical protein
MGAARHDALRALLIAHGTLDHAWRRGDATRKTEEPKGAHPHLERKNPEEAEIGFGGNKTSMAFVCDDYQVHSGIVEIK